MVLASGVEGACDDIILQISFRRWKGKPVTIKVLASLDEEVVRKATGAESIAQTEEIRARLAERIVRDSLQVDNEAIDAKGVHPLTTGAITFCPRRPQRMQEGGEEVQLVTLVRTGR